MAQACYRAKNKPHLNTIDAWIVVKLTPATADNQRRLEAKTARRALRRRIHQ